jgi:hypothetical protein
MKIIISTMKTVSKNNNNNTKSFMKELNKEWRAYTKQIDAIIDNENIHKNVTFVIRRKKGYNVSLCDIITDELKIMDKILDKINNN